MKLTQIVIGTLTASMLVFAVLVFLPSSQPGMHARWVLQPKTLDEAVRLANRVVVARVSAVRPGPDIVVPEPTEPGGEVRFPTQRVTFQVHRTLRGNAANTVELFKTGTDTQFIEGDPPYRPGETYVLFLTPKQDATGVDLVIAPEGRYRVVSGRLVPMTQSGFAAALQRKSLADFEQELSSS